LGRLGERAPRLERRRAPGFAGGLGARRAARGAAHALPGRRFSTGDARRDAVRRRALAPGRRLTRFPLAASDALGSGPVARGLLALDHARLRFGWIVALIGPNGAGKTTAFNAITRLYRLDSGEVVFDGRSLRRVRPSRVIRLGIARTFQNLELFPTLTVLENVLVGAHASSR